MPIKIQYDAQPYNLGSAWFFADSPAPSSDRMLSVCADKSACGNTPIRLACTVAGLRSEFSLSLDETEALVASLTHAVALCREHEAATRESA